MNIEQIKPEERDAGGRLTADGRTRALADVKRILLHYGIIRYQSICDFLGVSRAIARDLVREVISDLKEEFTDDAIVQAAFFKELMVERIDDPSSFTPEKRQLVGDMDYLMGRYVAFSGMAGENLSKKDMGNLLGFITAFSKINSRTKKLLDADIKKLENGGELSSQSGNSDSSESISS